MHIQIFYPRTMRRVKRYILGYNLGDTFIIVTSSEQLVSESELEVISGPETGLNLRFTDRFYAPNDEHTYTFVGFFPPNLRNLEYFSLKPILLQSTGAKVAKAIDYGTPFKKHKSFVSDEVLARINSVQRVKQEYEQAKKGEPRTYRGASHVHCIVGAFMEIGVQVSDRLHKKVRGVELLQALAVLKQLDLRIRQFCHFPIQFLCFYNPAFTAQVNLSEMLDIPDFNADLNVNNSHYINLYNLIWLIANDVLLGMAVRQLLLFYEPQIEERLSYFTTLSFERLDGLIWWIGADYPVGFKLNNELGQFLASLFLWTLQLWCLCITWLQCFNITALLNACCYLGFSFLLAALDDYVSLLSVHIVFFNAVTTKIYRRQVDALKSLTQLFRGRKYNVLRHRIDNLDKDQLHIDQLLLGTFMFMILIYLVPTTFAFYVLFFLLRLAVLTAQKLAAKVVIVLNLFPAFVILLKLKNSRRLQGGIYFETKGSEHNTNWLFMHNKALLYDEILRNFAHVFRQEGRIERLAMNFIEGKDMIVRDTIAMKSRYLMLPLAPMNLSRAWRAVSGK